MSTQTPPQQAAPHQPGFAHAAPATGKTYVRVSNVTKSFGAGDSLKLVCDDICLDIPEGSFTSIVGPSGCGKSTLLNMCAGLLAPDSGQINVNGTTISGPLRGVGYVTQDANLLPWKTVEQNVGLPLEVQNVPKRERAEHVKRWLDTVGLSGFSRHFPAQLSGGMQKRVSIARSLIYEPEFVLMDEPFGPLDAMTRVVLQQELIGLWQQQSKTVTLIFVTHDLQEAIALSDRVVVMSRHPGRIKEVIDVDIPRPRQVARITEDERYGQLHQALWSQLRDDLDIE